MLERGRDTETVRERERDVRCLLLSFSSFLTLRLLLIFFCCVLLLYYFFLVSWWRHSFFSFSPSRVRYSRFSSSYAMKKIRDEEDFLRLCNYAYEVNHWKKRGRKRRDQNGIHTSTLLRETTNRAQFESRKAFSRPRGCYLS